MDLFDRLSLALPRLRLLREEPLAAHTSFRIGGTARRLAFPANRQPLVSSSWIPSRRLYNCSILTPRFLQ